MFSMAFFILISMNYLFFIYLYTSFSVYFYFQSNFYVFYDFLHAKFNYLFAFWRSIFSCIFLFSIIFFFLIKFNYFCAFAHFTLCFSCIPSVFYFCSLKSLTLRSLQTHAVFFVFFSHERFLFHYMSCVSHCRLSVDFLN